MNSIPTNACKAFLYLVIQLGLNSLLAQNSGPTLPIRTQALYYQGTNNLQCKYEYYYDEWSEQKVFHGRYTTWDAKGRLKSEMTYVHGKKEGTSKYYDKRGRVQKQVTYIEGRRLNVFRPKRGGTAS